MKMTYEEFKTKSKESAREQLKAFDKEEVEEFLQSEEVENVLKSEWNCWQNTHSEEKKSDMGYCLAMMF